MARLLTRPTLARRDAPSPKQGRSELSLLRGGWDNPNCGIILTRPPTGTPRRATCPGEGLQISYAFLGGSGRGCPQLRTSTSTVSPCAFCEQGGHLAAPYPSFSSRALREHGDRPSHPTSFFSILLNAIVLARHRVGKILLKQTL